MNKKKTKCAVLLARVSSEMQNYQAQINDLRSIAEANGFNEFKIIGTKESGLVDLDEKLGTTEMCEFILANKSYNTVYTTEMSRLGRRQSVLHAVKDWFYDNNVNLYVKDSNFWLLDKDGEITEGADTAFTLFSLFAESEIRRKKDRFLRKRKDLMKEGLSISGKTLFGYKRISLERRHTTLVKHEENAIIVLQIFNWYLNGINSELLNPSVRAISQYCLQKGYPKYTHSKRNVNKLLKEEGYTGFKITNNKRKKTQYGKKKDGEADYIITQNEIKYPQIITQELFDAVQEKLKSRVTVKERATKHVTLLSRMIKCPECNQSLGGNYRKKEKYNSHSYRCNSRAKTLQCGFKSSLSMSLIDSAIWAYVRGDWDELLSTIDKFNPDDTINDLEEQKKRLESRKEEIDEEVEQLTKLLKYRASMRGINLDDLLTDTTKKLKKLDNEYVKISKEVISIEGQLSIAINEKSDKIHKKEKLERNLEIIEKSKVLLRTYLLEFVRSIDVIVHDVTYTVLRVNLKNYTKHIFIYDSENKYIDSEGNLIDKVIYLILDKSTTQDVKVYHTSTEPKDKKRFTAIDFIKRNALEIKDFKKLDVYD